MCNVRCNNAANGVCNDKKCPHSKIHKEGRYCYSCSKYGDTKCVTVGTHGQPEENIEQAQVYAIQRDDGKFAWFGKRSVHWTDTPEVAGLFPGRARPREMVRAWKYNHPNMKENVKVADLVLSW